MISNVLAADRLHFIREELRRNGRVINVELETQLAVSNMTVLRDLAKLEQEGEAKRVHGGAVLSDKIREEGFSTKWLTVSREKQAIARHVAANFIQPGDIVSVEGGTTVTAAVREFNQPNLTLLCNSSNALEFVPDDATVLCSGGVYRAVSRTFVGPQAEAFFASHRANICLISAVGFEPSFGLSDPDPLEVAVKRAMVQHADRTVLLLDPEKFGKRSLCLVVPLENIDTLVTIGPLTSQFQRVFERAKVDVHQISV